MTKTDTITASDIRTGDKVTDVHGLPDTMTVYRKGDKDGFGDHFQITLTNEHGGMLHLNVSAGFEFTIA